MDEYKKIIIDNFHHRSSSAKNIKGNTKKNTNLSITNEFTKINTLGTTNTSGTQPIIIYKKEFNNHNYNNNIKQIKLPSNNNKNMYISDGGLKKKLERYNAGHSYSIPNKKSSSVKKYKKTKKFYPTKKKLLKSSTQEKLFSQTMVGSFRRPNIPNKKKDKKNKVITNYLNDNKDKNKENKKLNKHLNNLPPRNLSEIRINDLDNKKKEKMKRLVENAIVYEMRKNEAEKKQPTLKDKITCRKKDYLENNGIETTWTIEEVQEYNNNKKDKNKENINDEKKDFKAKLKNKPKTDLNSNSHTINIGSSNYINNYNNLINSNEDEQLTLDLTKKKKRQIKPSVKSFEFIKKIQKEQKKLPFHIEISNHNKRQLNKNLSASSKINDSFRHKSATFKPNENSKVNSSENNIFDINESKQKKYPTIQFQQQDTDKSNDEFPFANKKNNRKPAELNEFIRKKKIKSKKEEENKEYEKNKKLFEIYQNLSNLKDSYNFSNNITNVNNSTSIFRRRNKKNMIRHKEINAYYIGTDSSRNGSTILDLNEYYLNILESQQLLVNSGFNKITDLSLNIESNENNKNNDMILEGNNNYNNNFIYRNYNNKELKQINNILKNNNNNNENLPNDEFVENEINNKINDTIKRVNEIISPKNLIENTKLDLTNINNNIKINNYFENKEIKNEKNDENKINNNINDNSDKKIKKLESINLENINNNINVNISSSELNTKEKNLPSLPHTFSNNSNPNKRVEIEIQPCAVLNLFEIIRLIFQRKVFFKLCQLYINHSYSQRYIIAFSFFVAICKQYPFKTIEDYCNYKTYYYAFRQLFRPFIRKNYKKFLNNCISVTKICYFVELLSRMIKFKMLELIYIYSQAKDQLKSACGIIMKIGSILVKSHLKKNFRELCDKTKKNKIKGKEKEKEKEKEKQKPTLNIDIDTFELVPFFQKKKNNSTRINSFMYESFDSKSNYSVHPNSVDNDILHQLQNYLMDNNKLHKIDKSKINKNLKDNFLYEDNSNKSQENLSHPKRNNNVKINYLNPQIINDNNKNKKDNEKEKIDDIKNKNNLILDIKKEDTNEFSPININNINNNDNSKKKEDNINKNEQKIKIEKIKVIKCNNPETNANTNIEKNTIKDNDTELNKDKEEENKNEKEDVKNENGVLMNKINNNNGKNEKQFNKEEIKEIEKIESDISAERDISKNIIWEYALSPISINPKNEAEEEKINKDDLKYIPEIQIEEENEEKLKGKENLKVNAQKPRENINSIKEQKAGEEKVNKEIINDDTINVDKNNKEKEIEDKNNLENKPPRDIENEDFDLEDILLSDPDENSKKSLKNSRKDENKNQNIKNSQIKDDENNIESKMKNKDISSVLNCYSLKNQEDPKEKENNKKHSKIELPEKFYDDLTEEIIKELINIEIIKKDQKLLPIKTFKNENIDVNLSNNILNNSSSLNFKENQLKEASFSSQNSIPYRDNSFPNFYLNESIISSFSASSIFNRTVKNKKKQKSLLLYLKKIAPILIKLIQEEIYEKYSLIFDNISIPLKNNSKEIMVALELQNGEMIRDNYKRSIYKEDIKDIIDKEKILKKIAPINKEIRNNDNIFDDNYYDRMLNECIIDTAIEIIKKERKYGEDGEPLPWGGRTRELIFKYEKDKPKKLVDFVTEQLINILNTKIGLINTNYEYLTQEQLNLEKEKRLIKTLKNELKENEDHWNNLEIEETQLKIEITEIINEQLYNEVMEILEHISLSRKRPELYQNKSIFVCEEIPKLSFQQNSTENRGLGYTAEENDLINIE